MKSIGAFIPIGLQNIEAIDPQKLPIAKPCALNQKPATYPSRKTSIQCTENGFGSPLQRENSSNLSFIRLSGQDDILRDMQTPELLSIASTDTLNAREEDGEAPIQSNALSALDLAIPRSPCGSTPIMERHGEFISKDE